MPDGSQSAQVPDLHFGIVPIQVGDRIMVQIQIADNFGLSTSLTLPQEIARAFSKGIKNAVEQAEVMIVKPPSLVAEA
jgi:hypothetical protein